MWVSFKEKLILKSPEILLLIKSILYMFLFRTAKKLYWIGARYIFPSVIDLQLSNKILKKTLWISLGKTDML